MEEPIIEIKTERNDVITEFEVIPISNKILESGNELNDIESRLLERQALIDELNTDIERLTNHADGIDNMIAVASGLLTGMIDAIFIGEFNFNELKADSNKHCHYLVLSRLGNKHRDKHSVKADRKRAEQPHGHYISEYRTRECSKRPARYRNGCSS